MNESQTFEFEGKEYEIKITTDGSTKMIRAFLDGKPKGYSYSVKLEEQLDPKLTNSCIDLPVKELISMVVNDIKNKTYEDLRKIHANKSLGEEKNLRNL